ncbi:hypothetical protein HELRODRAFT_166080 [Helobdella robusta]|uniref:Uncharacterized protein n=1 Tax=Helobdella robusta TaxID=6412 RepID=T1EXQ2_HELRO|nr:hypothetical protein HELRODRAFT_166080 [Helobdella robusta]ESN90414.1 hypothetical protein HELRODRAFT_166080 [Helobdella robusta]
MNNGDSSIEDTRLKHKSQYKYASLNMRCFMAKRVNNRNKHNNNVVCNYGLTDFMCTFYILQKEATEKIVVTSSNATATFTITIVANVQSHSTALATATETATATATETSYSDRNLDS